MLFGPIFSVELVTTARRARYLWLRVLCASFMAFVLVMTYSSYFDRPNEVIPLSRLASFARDFFNYFSFAQLGVVLLLTPAITAGTISLERERRTIEYLFATDLRNHEIVLGKLAARLVVILCLVIAGMPILSIAMLLGGIEPERLYMVAAVTLSTTVALAAFGMTISVWTKRSRDAVMKAYVVLAAFLALPLMLFATGTGWWTSIVQPVWDANPLVVFFQMFSGFGSPTGWEEVLWLVIDQGIIGTICVVSALVAVRRVHLRAVESPTKTARGRTGRALRTVSDRPMLWKELWTQRSRGQWGILGNLALALIATAVVLWTGYVFMEVVSAQRSWGFFRPVEQYLSYAMSVGTLAACLVLLVLAARASGAIAAEKERDTWISLLCSPLTPREIVIAKILGNLYAVRWLALLVAIIYAPTILLSADFLLAVPFLFGTMLILALFVTTVGVLFSLRSKNTLRAMGGTLVLTIFLGGGYLMCCCLPLMIGSGPSRGTEELMLAPCMPFLMCIPVLVYQALANEHSYLMHDGGLIVAYLLGMFGYAISTAVLYGVTVANFDELAGRTVPRRFGQ